VPHKLNDTIYWQGRRELAEKYGAHWIGEDEAPPAVGDDYQSQLEAHLSQEWLLKGIQRFVSEREQRLNRIAEQLADARG
jgi:hypothetical protein